VVGVWVKNLKLNPGIVESGYIGIDVVGFLSRCLGCMGCESVSTIEWVRVFVTESCVVVFWPRYIPLTPMMLGTHI
jgi:hypothetical protein